ncbi:MAG: hypothetical protein N0A16_01450 [Blastocatellia bacterium]|nr:hypothetical protein [Blastocatellia bacterium]MCS7156377.1 hypothetical protein [Blastocatellia bacterium]MCX7751272.1 hypothetical protein [Blastocatellia bacterium]MDW8168984.1 hypothetical protein [Acidobacteriota bacterium]MDW8256744.1 hypothetical protein [Acidobacteriota bacterium]
MAFGRRASSRRARGMFLALALGISLQAAVVGGDPPLAISQGSPSVEEGIVEILVEDHLGWARRSYALRQDARRFWLRGDTRALFSARTGMRARVRGIRHEKQIVALHLDLEEASEAQGRQLPETVGRRRVALLLLNFSDRVVRPYSVETARALLMTVAEFFRENSYGRLSLEGDVFGWFTLPMSVAACDPFRLAEEAHAVAQASGIDLSAYAHFVYAFPRNACSWWGLGTLGGAPSSAWINGTLAFDVLAHELGHGLGLSHSHALECGWVALGEACQVLEYGDTLDIMGMGAGHVSAVQKERLGWLREGEEILRVTEEGAFRLAPYHAEGDGPKALKILKSADVGVGYAAWYYVEYRLPRGFDRFLSRNSNVSRGVVVRLGISGERGGSFLLDLTPETASWLDPALTVGRSFTDPQTGLTILVHEVAASGALLTIAGIRGEGERSGILFPSARAQ